MKLPQPVLHWAQIQTGIVASRHTRCAGASLKTYWGRTMCENEILKKDISFAERIILKHNLDVIKTVDYIIDIGYEGGKAGGQVVAKGTPEQIIKDKKSYTAKFLIKELN